MRPSPCAAARSSACWRAAAARGATAPRRRRVAPRRRPRRADAGRQAEPAAPPRSRRWRYETARVQAPSAPRRRPAGASLAPARPQAREFGSPRVLGVTGAPRRLAARDRPERTNGERGVDPRAAPSRLGAHRRLDPRRPLAPRRAHVRGGDGAARGCRRRRPRRATRRRSAATRSPTCCRPRRPTRRTAAARSRSRATRRSCVPGWPGGDRLAIHGTPNPETVGHAGLARLHARARRRTSAR